MISILGPIPKDGKLRFPFGRRSLPGFENDKLPHEVTQSRSEVVEDFGDQYPPYPRTRLINGKGDYNFPRVTVELFPMTIGVTVKELLDIAFLSLCARTGLYYS